MDGELYNRRKVLINKMLPTFPGVLLKFYSFNNSKLLILVWNNNNDDDKDIKSKNHSSAVISAVTWLRNPLAKWIPRCLDANQKRI